MTRSNKKSRKTVNSAHKPDIIVVNSVHDEPISDTNPPQAPFGCVDDFDEKTLSRNSSRGKYPVPALKKRTVVLVDLCSPAPLLYHTIATELATSEDVYRQSARGAGLIIVPAFPGDDSQEVKTGSQLGVLITDRIRLLVTKDMKRHPDQLPAALLNQMIKSELFLTWFKSLDRVSHQPEFLNNFQLSQPGYNDGGEGQQIHYTGPKPQVLFSQDVMVRFLDIMAFASRSDRTNAVAAALTVELRRMWPGNKPLILITSTKSHGGKDTVLDFVTGETRSESVTYEKADWALQKAIVSALKNDPDIGLLDVGNVRIEESSKIGSAFLERFITDPHPLLHANGTGADVRRPNHLVLAMTTNYGSVSTDLANRALPIHLTPKGDVVGRSSPIGNPRHQYLPANRHLIAAELRGMIIHWKEKGCPLDESHVHPMTGWAEVIGGILKVNGFTDFLGNYGIRRTMDDPVREALAVIATEWPESDTWMDLSLLVTIVDHLGITNKLLPKSTQESKAGRVRGLAKVLDTHTDETFIADSGDKRFRLERHPESNTKVASNMYRFAVLK